MAHESPPLRIRLATVEDGKDLAAIYRPSVVANHASFELEAPTPAEMAARVKATTEKLPWLVAERDATVVGYAYASQHRARPAYNWSVDVSVYVAEFAHRQGEWTARFKQEVCQ